MEFSLSPARFKKSEEVCSVSCAVDEGAVLVADAPADDDDAAPASARFFRRVGVVVDLERREELEGGRARPVHVAHLEHALGAFARHLRLTHQKASWWFLNERHVALFLTSASARRREREREREREQRFFDERFLFETRLVCWCVCV